MRPFAPALAVMVPGQRFPAPAEFRRRQFASNIIPLLTLRSSSVIVITF